MFFRSLSSLYQTVCRPRRDPFASRDSSISSLAPVREVLIDAALMSMTVGPSSPTCDGSSMNTYAQHTGVRNVSLPAGSYAFVWRRSPGG